MNCWSNIQNIGCRAMPKMFKSVIKTLFQLCLCIKNLEGMPNTYTAPFPNISTEKPPAKTQTHKTEG